MVYRCVHCSEIYPDGANEVLTGCKGCKSKFFFYIKDEKLKLILQNKEEETRLSAAEKKQMEKDVREIVGITDIEQPVFLDFESVTVIKPGKYLIDLTKLFSANKPRIYKLEDGKYIIDLSNLALRPIQKKE